MEEPYANKDLATYFFHAKTSPHDCTDGEIKKCSHEMSIIVNYKHNINIYFRRNGFLDDLDIEISEADKEIIEIILSEGLDAAKKFVAEKRSNITQRRAWKAPQQYKKESMAKEAGDNSWIDENSIDDTVRILERG
ncbi:hypothetical protein HYU07_03085 [Candidatus Woesearchaeota archaeon]|nr:hypothetical protein [Candidatus Woesearchaeota archaeon]